MTKNPSDRLLRNLAVAGTATAVGGAALAATVFAGVAHSATASKSSTVSTSSTSGDSSSTGASTSTSSSSNDASSNSSTSDSSGSSGITAQQTQQAVSHGGSNGS